MLIVGLKMKPLKGFDLGSLLLRQLPQYCLMCILVYSIGEGYVYSRIPEG